MFRSSDGHLALEAVGVSSSNIVCPFEEDHQRAPMGLGVRCRPQKHTALVLLHCRTFIALFYDSPRCVTAFIQRLPSNFDPFFVSDGLKREQGMQQPNQGVYANLEAGNATTEASNQTSASPNDSSVGFLFRTAYTGFSSRAWDRLYLYFGLLWAMLCPIYLDGLVVSLERQHLAWVLLAMCGLAITPPTSVVLFKACFSSKLRPCVRQSKHSAVR